MAHNCNVTEYGTGTKTLVRQCGCDFSDGCETRAMSPARRPRRAATPSDESSDNKVRARRNPPAMPDGPRRHDFPLNRTEH